MSALLITKCPICNRETGHCIDSSLDKPRVEYDGKRCHACVIGSKAHAHWLPEVHCRRGRKGMALSTRHGAHY